MANTLPDVALPANTPVDLYAATGIAVGTAIVVTNKSSFNEVTMYTGASAPTDNSGVPIQPKKQGKNNAGEAGAWATSRTFDGVISVEQA